jgi:hypothetical protein
MGSVRHLKVDDLIVVTDVLTSYPTKAANIIGAVHSIQAVDPFGEHFVYLIKVDGVGYWVDGRSYSLLMMELL